MPEFSACYFCGTALDAPLAEYPVVPESLHPSADQQRTVVLCSSCRRKLGAVVDAVVGAVDDAPADASVQQELAAAGTDADEEASEDDDTHEDVIDGEDTNDGETADGETRDDEVGDDDIIVAEVDGHRAVEESRAEPAETDVEDGGEDDSVAFAEGTEDPSTAATASDGEVTAEAVGAAEDDEAPEDDTGTDDADDGTDDTDDGTDDTDEPQLTALEYNKVMRLLQNREFPVDHEEFRIVATNAYGISGEEFDRIIEAADRRDLIGLEGGQIVES